MTREPLARLVPDLDEGLIDLVDRCLAKRPDDRPQTMADIRRDLAAVRRRIARDEQPTMMLRPAGALAGASKPGRRDMDRQEVLRIREQLERFIGEARRALDSAELPAAERACQQALVLDSEFGPALDLADSVRAAFEDQHIKAWLKEAQNELQRGALTAASLLVDRALSLSSSSPEAMAVPEAIDEARRQLAERDERTRIVNESVATARRQRRLPVPLDAALVADGVTGETDAIRSPDTRVLRQSAPWSPLRFATLAVGGIGIVVLLGFVGARFTGSTRNDRARPPRRSNRRNRRRRLPAPAARCSHSRAADGATPSAESEAECGDQHGTRT